MVADELLRPPPGSDHEDLPKPDPLELTLEYHSKEVRNISCCAFSPCGKYFAFTEGGRTLLIYSAEHINKLADEDSPEEGSAYVPAPGEGADQQDPWRGLIEVDEYEPGAGTWKKRSPGSASENGVQVSVHPLRVCYADSPVTCLEFGRGHILSSRRPSRRSRRFHQVIRGDEIEVLVAGLASGKIEVYNVRMLLAKLHVCHMLLACEADNVLSVAISSDNSLRLASAYANGSVRLWDIWDEGNMYSKLEDYCIVNEEYHGSLIVLTPNSPETRFYGRGCAAAWQPEGEHICVVGYRGFGTVLMAEHPFKTIVSLHGAHFHNVIAASYTRDGSILLTGALDSSVIAWTVPEYSALQYFWHIRGPPYPLLLGGYNGYHIYGLNIAVDELHFATVCEDGGVRVWAIAPNRSPAFLHSETIIGHRTGPRNLSCCKFNHCGKLLAASVSSGKLLFFKTASDFNTLINRCVHVLRRQVIRHLLKAIPHPVDMSCPALDDEPSTLFARAIETLNLPPEFRRSIARDFHSILPNSANFFNTRPLHVSKLTRGKGMKLI